MVHCTSAGSSSCPMVHVHQQFNGIMCSGFCTRSCVEVLFKVMALYGSFTFLFDRCLYQFLRSSYGFCDWDFGFWNGLLIVTLLNLPSFQCRDWRDFSYTFELHARSMQDTFWYMYMYFIYGETHALFAHLIIYSLYIQYAAHPGYKAKHFFSFLWLVIVKQFPLLLSMQLLSINRIRHFKRIMIS